MNNTPRWKHKCPTPICKRVIFHEYVYCNKCRMADPRKRNFKITRSSSYRKGHTHGLLPTMKMTRDHLFAMIKQYTLCVECGHKVEPNNLRHRCYFLTDAAARPLEFIRCRVCRFMRPKHLFPLFRRRGKMLRTRVCSDCLNNNPVLVHQKRKYERRVDA